MRLMDGVAIAVLVVAAVALGAGEAALAHARDLEALYLLLVGIVGVQAAVQLGRPGRT